jgi:exodeoxyribonuclease VII large subunit
MLASSLREARTRLESWAGRLDSVSYQKVLERGFALVTDAAHHPLTRAAEIRPGTRLRIQFADATTEATATKPNPAQSALPF